MDMLEEAKLANVFILLTRFVEERQNRCWRDNILISRLRSWKKYMAKHRWKC
jgi:hypothetical protein